MRASVFLNPKGHPDQEPDLGVGGLDQGVGQVVFEHVLDRGSVAADLAG